MLISRKQTGHDPLCFCLPGCELINDFDMPQQPPGVDNLDALIPTFAELVPLTVVGMLQTGGMDANSDGDTMLSTDGVDELPATSVPVVATLYGATMAAAATYGTV